MYWTYMSRRSSVDDRSAMVEDLIYAMDEERWKYLYTRGLGTGTGDTVLFEGTPIEEWDPVMDVSDLDEYFSALPQKRTLSGAALTGALEEGGWL